MQKSRCGSRKVTIVSSGQNSIIVMQMCTALRSFAVICLNFIILMLILRTLFIELIYNNNNNNKTTIYKAL